MDGNGDGNRPGRVANNVADKFAKNDLRRECIDGRSRPFAQTGDEISARSKGF